jgi:hypothetical protein
MKRNDQAINDDAIDENLMMLQKFVTQHIRGYFHQIIKKNRVRNL